MTVEFSDEQPGIFKGMVRYLRRRAFGKTIKPLSGILPRGKVQEQLQLIPQDLRTADPSFTTEVFHGHFGLAGAVATTIDQSPFQIKPPNKSWEKDLHGFVWLRHFNASQDEQAFLQAEQLVGEWIKYCSNQQGIAWQPEIVARRLISWICHMGPLLDDAEHSFYNNVMYSMKQQISFLANYISDTPDGQPRLISLIAMNLAGLCISNQEALLKKYLGLLSKELDRQILEDGGHISRNPWVPVMLMFDLLPLKQCFVSRNKKVPDSLADAIRRIFPMIRFMRMGDGVLGHFNGMSATLPDMLATILAYDDYSATLKGYSAPSGYSRIEQGSTVVLADTGFSPNQALSQMAHAGCLSFEMSTGVYPLIVNSGSPGPANQEWLLTSRTTPYHSCLSINKNSSAKLVKKKFFRKQQSALVKGPENVTVECGENAGVAMINASHDGFSEKYNAVYSRKLLLSQSGDRLEGQEHLWPIDSTPSKQRRFPFTLHFHIHPDLQVQFTEDRHRIEITLPNAEKWIFSTKDLVPALEESLFFADYRGVRRTLQIVLRGVCNAKAKFVWFLEKTDFADEAKTPPPAPDNKVPSRMAQIQKKLIFKDID